jgi:hypothetical protein
VEGSANLSDRSFHAVDDEHHLEPKDASPLQEPVSPTLGNPWRTTPICVDGAEVHTVG